MVKSLIFSEFFEKKFRNLKKYIFSVKNIVILYFYHILHKKVERLTILRFLKFSTVFDVGPFKNQNFGLATRFFDFKIF